MSSPSRIPAVMAYLIPVLGWLYVLTFQRKNALAMYHLRQAVGLFLFLVGVLLGWAVIAWVVVWIPYMGALSAAFFAVVMAAYFFGIVAWTMGVINALRNRAVPLPGIGQWASRLPIR